MLEGENNNIFCYMPSANLHEVYKNKISIQQLESFVGCFRLLFFLQIKEDFFALCRHFLEYTAEYEILMSYRLDEVSNCRVEVIISCLTCA